MIANDSISSTETNFRNLTETSKNWQNIKNKCRSYQTSAATTEIQKVQPSKIQTPTDKKSNAYNKSSKLQEI